MLLVAALLVITALACLGLGYAACLVLAEAAEQTAQPRLPRGGSGTSKPK